MDTRHFIFHEHQQLQDIETFIRKLGEIELTNAACDLLVSQLDKIQHLTDLIQSEIATLRKTLK